MAVEATGSYGQSGKLPSQVDIEAMPTTRRGISAGGGMGSSLGSEQRRASR